MGSFEVVRRTTISAPPAAVHALLDDFHQWTMWSPWEDLDPDLNRTYSGSDSGVGSRYAWQGNRKAGKGTMEITGSTPESVQIRLEFEKPFAAVNQIRFDLEPAGGGTDVAWRMTGEQTGLWAVVGRLYPMDKMVGKDFEKGLTRLKAVAEKPA